MARLKSIFKVEGSFGGMTHVRSKTYGDHIRAVRGTHKPAEVNAAFKASGQQLIKANEMAKLILDGINPYRQNFKGGLLWQRLVSLFKGQYKAAGTFNLEALAGFEVWKEYPLNRFFKGGLDFTVMAGDNLMVELNYDSPPDFKRKFADGCRFTLIALYPSLPTGTCPSAYAEGPVTRLAALPEPLVFTLPMPADATAYLLCLKVEACEGERIPEGFALKGMCFFSAGEIRIFMD